MECVVELINEGPRESAGLFFMPNLVTLSTLGIAQNPQEAAIRLLQYYNESKPAQSTTYPNGVPSLALRIVEDGNDPDRLMRNVRDDISRIFSDHFDNVEIEATTVDNNDGTFDVHISGTYQYRGLGYKLNENYTTSSEKL